MNKWHFKLSSRGRWAKVYGRRRSASDYRQNNFILEQESTQVADGVVSRELMELPSSRVSVDSSNFASASLSCSTCPSNLSSLSEFATNRRREAVRGTCRDANYRGDETRRLLHSSIAKRKGTPPPSHRIGPVCGCKDRSSCIHTYSLTTETTSLSDASLHICTGYPSAAENLTIDKSSGSPNDSVFYDAPQTPARAPAILGGFGEGSSTGDGSSEHVAGSSSAADEEEEAAEEDNMVTAGTWSSLATVQCDLPLGIQDGNVVKETRNSVHAPLPVAKTEDREETILEILREIVRKCTNTDPSKRPTARDVLSMLSSLLNV